MNNRSKSSLFLMEQLVVIIIFAICATACVKIFVDSYLTTAQAKDISQALLTAQNGAEAYKAVGGDTAQLAELLGGERKNTAGADTVYTFYSQEWQVCSEAEAVYVLVLTCHPLPTEPIVPLYADLAVKKTTGEELIAFTVAVGGTWDE